MSWSVEWTPQIQRALLDMPWRDAARIAEALLAFAATGEGDVRRGDRPDERRLNVGAYRVRLTLDLPGRTLTAWFVFRMR